MFLISLPGLVSGLVNLLYNKIFLINLHDYLIIKMVKIVLSKSNDIVSQC